MNLPPPLPAKKSYAGPLVALVVTMVVAFGLLVYCGWPIILSICSPAYANMRQAKADPAWGDGYYAGLSAGQRIGEVSTGEMAAYAVEFTRGRGDGPAALFSMRKGYVAGYIQAIRQSRR